MNRLRQLIYIFIYLKCIIHTICAQKDGDIRINSNKYKNVNKDAFVKRKQKSNYFNNQFTFDNNTIMHLSAKRQQEREYEANRIKYLKPLKNDRNYIMFWRPQKVGSSTLLSIFISYSYRYNEIPKGKLNNGFCIKIYNCMIHNKSLSYSESNSFTMKPNNLRIEDHAMSEIVNYTLSINHELCNIPSKLVYNHLSCAFKMKYLPNSLIIDYNTIDRNLLHNNDIKEVFILRNPLSRMISIYYFWGELSRLRLQRNKLKKRIGQSDLPSSIIEFGLFTYHGNESTVPSNEIALKFAEKFPLYKGMPGPSYTWTAFANSPKDAMSVIQTDRIMCLVLERLDESLVVLSQYLNWSLADMVVTMHRKSLSSHPKSSQWPTDAIDLINKTLESSGEYNLYRAAIHRLDQRILYLKRINYPFDDNLKLLKDLRQRVSQLCLSEEYLQRYKTYLQNDGLHKHLSDNRLRDVDDKYDEEGHALSLNGEILYSYDVCGNCEAHALLLGYQLGLSSDVSKLPTLDQLDKKYTYNNVNFIKCPN